VGLAGVEEDLLLWADLTGVLPPDRAGVADLTGVRDLGVLERDWLAERREVLQGVVGGPEVE
jgi:hypothetical protein